MTPDPHKHPEDALHFQPEWCRVTLASIGDAVITTDTEGRVTFLNSVAESLTGWMLEEATGQPLASVFRIINEESRQPVESPTMRPLREGVVVGLPPREETGVSIHEERNDQSRQSPNASGSQPRQGSHGGPGAG